MKYYRLRSRRLDILGLVAAFVKKFKISEKMNLLLLKKSNNQKINHAQVFLVRIYQCLGCGDGRLYFSKEFFFQ